MPASNRAVASRHADWLPGRHGRLTTAAWSAGSALAFILAVPPVHLWPLTIVSLAALTWLAVRLRPGAAGLLTVWAVFSIMWLWLNRWVVPITTAGYPLMSLAMAAFTVGYVVLVRRASRSRTLGGWPLALLAPVVWVALETLRSKGPHGYPWLLAGHPLIERPVLVQFADVLGALGASFLVAMTAGAVVDGVLAVRLRQARRWRVVGLVGAVWVANVAYGAWRMQQEDPLRPGPTLLVVQTNLPQSNKMDWPPEQQVEDVKTFIDQTREGMLAARQAGRDVDLIVWPETMLPGYGLEPETIEMLVTSGYYPGDLYAQAMLTLHEGFGTPLLVGSPTYLGLRAVGEGYEWDEHYNAAYLIDGPPPHDRYDKVFLTPFGERMPYVEWWPWLEEQVLAVGARGMTFDLDAAAEPRVLELASTDPPVTLATPICFEDTVASLCRAMVYEGGKRVDLLVNLSNDGWFGTSMAGRQQHVQAARFRCIENRVPMVRAANTGLSVAIDSRGSLVETIGEGRYGEAPTAGTMLAGPALDGRRTIYGRIGDTLGWACLTLTGGAVLIGVLTARPRSRRSAATTQGSRR